MNAPSSPKLAPPGAGLPFPENLIARFIVGPLQSRKYSWEENLARFEREGEKILQYVEGLSEAELNRQVLVPRLRALEDSSRFWSIAMTLDHLLIVGENMSWLIQELSNGRTPNIQVSTARVKPEQKELGCQIVARFRAFVKETGRNTLKHVNDRDSKTTLAHPWFGPFTAQQWFWLMSAHQAIHRNQVKHILAGLR